MWKRPRPPSLPWNRFRRNWMRAAFCSMSSPPAVAWSKGYVGKGFNWVVCSGEGGGSTCTWIAWRRFDLWKACCNKVTHCVWFYALFEMHYILYKIQSKQSLSGFFWNILTSSFVCSYSYLSPNFATNSHCSLMACLIYLPFFWTIELLWPQDWESKIWPQTSFPLSIFS